MSTAAEAGTVRSEEPSARAPAAVPRSLHPPMLMAYGVVASALVWLLPWPHGWRTGFTTKEPLTAGGVGVLLAWYGTVGLVAAFAWSAGRGVAPVARLDRTPDAFFYRVFTVVGIAGVVVTYALAELTHPGVVLEALRDSQFNRVRTAIPYQAGFTTLRYATVLGGGLALYHLLARRQVRFVHVANLVALVLAAAVASRLSLVMALFVFVGVTAVRMPGALRTGRVIAVGVLAFVVLGALNYTRNANFYEVNYGTTNAVSMNVQEIVTYLGSPFQVSLAVGASGPVDYPSASTVLANAPGTLVPQFLWPSGGVTGASWYRGLVPVDDGLTTNSALVQLYGAFGLWSFLVITLAAGLAAFVAGHASRYRSLGVLACFVIGYAFLELWRTYLFTQGIVVFLVLLIVATAAAGARER